jgi:hypothetical protein
MARPDPELRSHGGGKDGGRVERYLKIQNTGEDVLSGVFELGRSYETGLAGVLWTQKAPNKTAPTNANTAQTASTSNLKARST